MKKWTQFKDLILLWEDEDAIYLIDTKTKDIYVRYAEDWYTIA